MSCNDCENYKKKEKSERQETAGKKWADSTPVFCPLTTDRNFFPGFCHKIECVKCHPALAKVYDLGRESVVLPMAWEWWEKRGGFCSASECPLPGGEGDNCRACGQAARAGWTAAVKMVMNMIQQDAKRLLK